MTFFDPVELADPLVSGDLADPDHDRIPNIQEYLFNLHPKERDGDISSLPMSGSFTTESDEVALTWSQHRKRAENLMIAVEFSPTLLDGSWQQVLTPVEVITSSGAMETLRVARPMSGSTRGFFRLALTQPEP